MARLTVACLLLGCAHYAAVAADGAPAPLPALARVDLHAAVGQFLSGADARPRDRLGRPVAPALSEPPLARAIGLAVKEDTVALGVKESAEMLAACQREHSSLQTVPFMRSESQQAHCYRF